MMQNFYFKDIEPILGQDYEILGHREDVNFNSFVPVSEANNNAISWIRYKLGTTDTLLSSAQLNTLICDKREAAEPSLFPGCKVIVKVDNPRLIFSRIVSALYQNKIEFSVHPSASIHPNAKLGKNIHIGPHCTIGNCTIGDNTIIYGNAFVFDDVIIGRQVTIMPNATIGGVGFGYEKNENGEFELFPHIGGVVIEDFVDIGASTCIDRGVLGNTYIGMGTKIDNLVHIAHNVKIGKNCAIIAHAMIGGSTVINDNCWVAPASCLRDGIAVGNDATVGLGAVVLKSIPPGETWVGSPAKLFISKQKS